MSSPSQRPPKSVAEPEPGPLEVVADALDGLRFGVVQLKVREGKLVQVDITERRRFG